MKTHDTYSVNLKNCYCHTEGTRWSRNKAKVHLTIMELKIRFWNSRDDFSSGLNLYFDDSWDVERDNLIYSSELFLKEFREYLKVTYNFSDEALEDIDYSEAGMQGDDYVNFDLGDLFYEEFVRIPEIAKVIIFS